MDDADKPTALTLAAWLRSVHTQGAIFAAMLLAVAMLGIALGAAALLHGSSSMKPLLHTASFHGSMVLFAIGLLALLPAERLLCLRLQFDANLFSALGRGQSDLTDIDQALLEIGLRKAQVTTRSLDSRIAGTRRLVRWYAWVLSAQFLLALGLCAQAGYFFFYLTQSMP